MIYEITLLEADIHDPMDGTMVLGLRHQGEICGKLAYSWDVKMFSAVFHGHAPSLPHPAHPTTLLQRPIAALNAKRTGDHPLITDVFRDHQISINIET